MADDPVLDGEQDKPQIDRGGIRATRSMRADARLNRDKIIAAARVELHESVGAFAMDAVASRAGVGPGTLYRHFPTRGALVEAVYEDELLDLSEGARALLLTHEPDAALREWLARYMRFAATKRGMLEVLKPETCDADGPMRLTRQRLSDSLVALLSAGMAAGTIRHDVVADDVTVLLHGLFIATASGSDAAQGARLLDLVFDALRSG